MAMKASRVPEHLQANRDALAALGVDLDASGKAIPVGMQGNAQPGEEPVEVAEGELPVVAPGKVVQTVQTFGRMEEDGEVEHPGEPAASDLEPLPGEPEPLTGMAKREADAREAQRQMSKTQRILEQTEARIRELAAGLETKFAALAQQIERLSQLRTTVGDVPAELRPASKEVLAHWRENYQDALDVMDFKVAPLYQRLSSLEARFQDDFDSRAESDRKATIHRIFEDIYRVIPEDVARKVCASQEFVEWYGEQDPEYRTIIKKAVEDTESLTDASTFINVMKRFSRETGFDLGLTPRAPAPSPGPAGRDSYPNLRGAAAPLRGVQLRRAPDETVPLSVEELGNFHERMSTATEAEKAILRKRFAATSLTIDGSIGQSLK